MTPNLLLRKLIDKRNKMSKDVNSQFLICRISGLLLDGASLCSKNTADVIVRAKLRTLIQFSVNPLALYPLRAYPKTQC